MSKQKSLLLVIFATLVLACLQTAAFGQAANDGNLANVTGGGSSIRWDVIVQNSGGNLTITAPDGRVFYREFKAGGSPEISLNDRQLEKLPDGSYGYELRLRPVLSAGEREALKAARAKDDDAEGERAGRKRPAVPVLVQSGGFAILNGSIIVGGAVEGRSNAKSTEPSRTPGVVSGNTVTRLRNHRASLMPDFVIADDLIVQGSACIGLDCVNGESFGFDTIRLKENNTRISFNDTSVGTFPTNDWTIRANSSASGGQSFLGFVDRGTTEDGSEVGTIVFEVDAGAPANSLRVSSSGKLGIRTGTPVLDVHVTSSDTPAHRLEQTNAGGFTAQTWDVAGNEANFFVRDVTGGSRLPFRIRPGAPTSSIDISANGNVGIGTASPSDKLSVSGSALGGTIGGFIKNTAGTNALSRFSVGQTNSEVVGLLLQFDHSTDTATVLNRRSGTGTLELQTTGGGLLIANSGGVTVGAPSGGEKGAGSINAVTVWRNGTSLDSVFEEGYNLFSINEMGAYVRANHHLPTIPTGEVNVAGSTNMGSLTDKLWETVEVQARYILELNERLKKLEEQQKEIAAPKGQVRKLGATSRRRRK